MKNDKKTCVIIPIYKDSFTELEELTFYRNIKVLINRDIILIGPPDLENHLLFLSKNIRHGKIKIFDKKYFNGHIRDGSRLFMNKEFYQSFIDYDFMLICHFDAIVFYDNIDYWASNGFDNIGSPLFHNHGGTIYDVRKGLNGGFCLRNIKTCLRVLNNVNFSYSDLGTLWRMEEKILWKIFRVFRDGLLFNFNNKFFKPVINEDMFWSVIAPNKYLWFKSAKFEDAIYFAFEENARLLFKLNNNTYPMGMHGWWKFDKEFASELIENFDKNNNSIKTQNHERTNRLDQN